jgi:hypothetical protein
VKTAQQVNQEYDDQNRAESNAGPAARSPSAIAIVAPASAKKQNQKNYKQ